MGLFDDNIIVKFDQSELDEILKPIVGSGGHQNLMRDVAACIKGHVGAFDDAMLRKVHQYAYSYGGGGFQGRFRLLLAAARRAGWQYQ